MMTDYKQTLNLPNTTFPMRANLAKREPLILQHWEKIKLYQQLRALGQKRKKFILHDGPPYANGPIHIGHAVNKTLKDIVIRSKTLSGFDTPYLPGWDCHGLPIELNVEKKQGIKVSDKTSAKAFRQACRHYAQSQVAQQQIAFQRLGVMANWQKPYLTMDWPFEANTIQSLAAIMAKGYVQQGYKPIHWCCDCQSALAEAEVEYQAKLSPAIYVKFKVINSGALLTALKINAPAYDSAIVIWTTTPWTLLANQAVALNSQLDYALITIDHEMIWVSRTLLSQVTSHCKISNYQLIASVKGKLLEQVMLQHPLLDRQVPVVLADHVSAITGTGCVHTAPAHGLEDYQVGQRYQLSMTTPVTAEGRFSKDSPLLPGESVYRADNKIIALLQQHHALLHATHLEHSYPHCWRHHRPLIFRATAQWFISMKQTNLLASAKAAVANTKWLPTKSQKNMLSMLDSRPDWCISRQRLWGVPMALILDKDSGKLHPDYLTLMAKVAKLVAKHGIEAWYDLDIKHLLGEKANHYIKSSDVLDVWFDSGITHTAVLKAKPELQFPADLYLEGADQHRGWFQTSLLTACALYGQAPYRQVLTHGFVVDSQGRKMSKSVGNVVMPEKVMKTLGADILRLWVAGSDYHDNITFSTDTLDRTCEMYRRIRNTARFLLANLDDFNPSTQLLSPPDCIALDIWAMQKAKLLQQHIIDAYNNYHFQRITQQLHHFCSIDMGSFYLDVIKDRQYTLPANHRARRSAQTAMFHIIASLVRCLAPICPFTAEEIWQHLPFNQQDSVFLSTWYEGFPQIKSPAITLEQWQQIIDIRNSVNKALAKLRHRNILGANLEAEVTLYAKGNVYQLLALLQHELRFIFITSNAKVLPLIKEENAMATEIADLKLQVNASPYPKCQRCWQQRQEVGQHLKHPSLCDRCIANIDGSGEKRYYA